MAGTCDCTAVVFGNTGEASCNKIQEIARHLILTSTYDASGAAKSESLDDLAVYATGISPNLVNTDIRERFYPIKNLENVTNVREESIKQTFNSGRSVKVRDGFKRFTGFMINAPYGMEGELKALACFDLSAYVIDKADNLIGLSNQEIVTDLSAIRISPGSVDIMYVEPTDSEVGGIMIGFDWAFSQKDQNLYILSQNDMDWIGDDMTGLITANYAFSSISTTAFTLALQTPYGENITGLEAADFALAETSPTPGAVTIDSVTESSDGVYVFDVTTASLSSADELTLTPTKSPYDFAKVIAYNIVIP